MRRIVLNLLFYFFSILIYIPLLLANLIGRIVPGHRKILKDIKLDFENLTVGVYILSHNGLDYLKRFLKSVIEACRLYGDKAHLYVIDNGSTDGTAEWLRIHRHEVAVVANKRNYYFPRGYNHGLKGCREDIIVLLNNDMRVEPDFLAELVNAFKLDKKVSAAASQVYFFDPNKRRDETGFTAIYFSRGNLHYAHHSIPENAPTTLPVYWVGGGACAVPNKIFRMLGGFHDFFNPAYFEDVALSYKIWKRGGRCVLAPDSKVFHLHQGTTGDLFSQTQMAVFRHKNEILFQWLCFSDLKFLLWSMNDLPRKLLGISERWGITASLKILLLALKSYPAILCRRIIDRRYEILRDREVFDLIDTELEKYRDKQ